MSGSQPGALETRPYGALIGDGEDCLHVHVHIQFSGQKVDVSIEVLNTYVGLYEFENSALKTLQVRLQGNDLEIDGTDVNGTVLFVDKLVTLGPNKFAVDNKRISVRFIIENDEVVAMESIENQLISVSRRVK